MRRHLQEQVSIYGKQNLVSLVNRKGREKPINDAYELYVAQVCSGLILFILSNFFQGEFAERPVYPL
jgi:phosphatidylinositol 4-phosphatase